MLTEDGLVALECNPRGTSGIHLASQDRVRLSAALMGDTFTVNSLPAQRPYKPAMLNLAFFIYHWSDWYKGATRKDYLRAKNALKIAGIPWIGQIRSTMELLINAKKVGMNPLEWSTRDIEFNGFES